MSTASTTVSKLTRNQTIAERDRLEAIIDAQAASPADERRMADLVKHSYFVFGTLLWKLEPETVDTDAVTLPALDVLEDADLVKLACRLDDLKDAVADEYRSRKDYVRIYLDPSDLAEFKRWLTEAKVSWKGESGYVGITTVEVAKGKGKAIERKIEKSKFSYAMP